MTPLPNITVETVVEHGWVRLRLAGELDLATRAQLEDAVDRLKAEQQVSVYLDLYGLEFLDAAGLQSLERAIEEGREQGWLRVKSQVRPQVQRLLELTGTERLLRAV